MFLLFHTNGAGRNISSPYFLDLIIDLYYNKRLHYKVLLTRVVAKLYSVFISHSRMEILNSLQFNPHVKCYKICTVYRWTENKFWSLQYIHEPKLHNINHKSFAYIYHVQIYYAENPHQTYMTVHCSNSTTLTIVELKCRVYRCE